MEKSDFVNYRMLAAEVEQLRLLIGRLDAELSAASSPQLSFAPKAPRWEGSAPFENKVLKLIEVRREYEAKKAEQIAQLRRVEAAIDSLTEPAERVVMRDRYLLGWSWARICAVFAAEGYCERSVYKLHGYALLKLKEV